MAKWKCFFIVWCIGFSFLVIPFELFAEKPDTGFFSLRGGFSEKNVGNNDESFNQYEAALTLMLPWKWEPLGVLMKTGVDFTAGILSGGDEDAFVGSVGPRVSFRTFEENLSFDFGVAPTYISKYEFDTADFGGEFQFTSFAGVYLHFLDRCRVGYRFQHMSNAGIYSKNDGLDMHMFEAGFLF